MAYLTCVDPVSGTTRDLPLKKPLLSIGRKPGNDIVLQDATVAGVHANLIRQGRNYSLSVVGRGNEVYVNGRATRQATIAPGDKVLIGRFELTLIDGAPKPQEAPAQASTHVDAMSRLVEFSATLMREESPERLFRKLLESVVELTKAEKGFVIVLKDGGRHLAASHNVGDEKLDISRVSDTIIDQVIRDRRAVIVSDAMADRRYGHAQSVVDLKLSSVMCVPLLYRNDLLGVLYLGNDAITGLFTERDLALLRVWASQASLAVHAALLLNELKISNRNLRERLRSKSQGAIVGSSRPMKAVFRMIRKVSPTDLSVLVLGETGTGKELVAREIHRLSDRARKPFVSINCGAIPENLLESELFGHKKGSFTGAVADKVGRFEAANGGTLFLDEIGEMPMPLQVKLLRVLQERVIERVGELSPRPVDIRVVSATNKELEAEIREGRFREDLYYRLNVVPIDLPPLREREGDVPLLTQHFVRKLGQGRSFTVKTDVLEAMSGYAWPGNVRELENHVAQAIAMAGGSTILKKEHLLPVDKTRRAALEPPTDLKSLREVLVQAEREHLRKVLRSVGGHRTKAASVLGISRKVLWEKLKDYGIE